MEPTQYIYNTCMYLGKTFYTQIYPFEMGPLNIIA